MSDNEVAAVDYEAPVLVVPSPEQPQSPRPAVDNLTVEESRYVSGLRITFGVTAAPDQSFTMSQNADRLRAFVNTKLNEYASEVTN